MTVKRKNMLSNIPWWVTSGIGAVESCYGSTNGYIRFTNGLKIIWGVTNRFKLSTYHNSNYNFTYHTSFTGSVMWGICSFVNIQDSSNLANCTPYLCNISKTSASASIDYQHDKTSATGQICYLIIGNDTV